MAKERQEVSIGALLDTPKAIAKWKTDPLACFEDAGISLSHLDPQTKQALNKWFAKIDPTALKASSGCIACTAGVTAALAVLTAALAAAIVALVVSTAGGDAPAVPAEVAASVELSAAAIAEATGVAVTEVVEIETVTIIEWFTWILASPVKAALMMASGTMVLAIYGSIANKICQRCGACG